jgi:hypothetical protein
MCCSKVQYPGALIHKPFAKELRSLENYFFLAAKKKNIRNGILHPPREH